MGSLYERKKGVWRIYFDAPPTWRDGNQVRRQKTETVRGSRHDALARLTVLEAQIAGGRYVEPIDQLLGDWITQWLAGKANLRPTTRRVYQAAIRYQITPQLGGLRVCDVRAEHIEAAGALWQRSSMDQARKALKILRQAFKLAHQRGRLPRNEAALVEMPSPERGEMRYYRLAEIEQLLERCRSLDEHGPPIAVACCTGLRQGELLALRWADVDLANRRLSVRRSVGRVTGEGHVYSAPKTRGSIRVVRLMADVVPFFEQQRRWQADIHGYWPTGEALVFTHHWGGPLDRALLYKAFVRCCAELGLSRIRFHDLRHTFATWALTAGVPVKVVSEALGHTSPTITMSTYAHVLPGMQEAGMELMSAALRAGRDVEREAR